MSVITVDSEKNYNVDFDYVLKASNEDFLKRLKRAMEEEESFKRVMKEKGFLRIEFAETDVYIAFYLRNVSYVRILKFYKVSCSIVDNNVTYSDVEILSRLYGFYEL